MLQRLADSKEKLAQYEASSEEDVRGRGKKIEGLQKTISQLELRVSQLTNTAPSSVVADPVTLRFIRIAPIGSTASFTSIEVKQEQLEITVPENGPGSRQDPMQIDCAPKV